MKITTCTYSETRTSISISGHELLHLLETAGVFNRAQYTECRLVVPTERDEDDLRGPALQVQLMKRSGIPNTTKEVPLHPEK